MVPVAPLISVTLLVIDILNEILDKEGDCPRPVVLEDEEGEDVENDSPERDSFLSSLTSISKDSVYSTLSGDSQLDSRISFTSAISKGSELSLASKKSLKFFVSSLKDCMDSGYAEDSDESSIELTTRLDTKEEKGYPRPRHRFSNKIYKLFKSKSQLILGKELKYNSEIASLSLPLRRAESLCNPVVKHHVPTRSRRAQSLPQPALSATLLQHQMPWNTCVKRRPILSCDEDTKISKLRVVVFGSDRISGKVARAYSNLKWENSHCFPISLLSAPTLFLDLALGFHLAHISISQCPWALFPCYGPWEGNEILSGTCLLCTFSCSLTCPSNKWRKHIFGVIQSVQLCLNSASLCFFLAFLGGC